jgi:hypothetical protein
LAADVTKASAGRRRRRLEKRGRPTGTYASLFKDPQRFSIVAWVTLEPIFGPHVAARAATVWIEEKTPITIQTVQNLLIMVGADYASPPGASEDLDDHARALARKARLVTSRATRREFAWLTQSSGALLALMRSLAEGDVEGANRAVELLQEAGWGEIVERINRRLVPALRANFPPFEGPLTAKARRLLAAMRPPKT